MVSAVALSESIVGGFVRKQRLHALHFKFHFNIGGKLFYHFLHGVSDVFLCVQSGTDSRKEMGVIGVDNMLFVQLQGSDESLLQLG